MSKEYLDGYKKAIEDLRSLGINRYHIKSWSHSRELRFAPVELSDYLVLIYNKKLKE